MNDNNRLISQQEYLLFLGKQDDEENSFYVTGGTQGKFYVEKDQIIAGDPLMKSELEKFGDDGATGVDIAHHFVEWIKQ